MDNFPSPASWAKVEAYMQVPAMNNENANAHFIVLLPLFVGLYYIRSGAFCKHLYAEGAIS
jgi:hypothetical protein